MTAANPAWRVVKEGCLAKSFRLWQQSRWGEEAFPILILRSWLHQPIMIVYHLTCSDDISRLHDICKDSSIVNEERNSRKREGGEASASDSFV